MTQAYRVLRRRFARAPFDGEGAFRYGGRWSSPGVRLSYTSEHESLALLEYFVHLDSDDPPDDLVLAVADVPEDLGRTEIRAGDLPRSWRSPSSPLELAKFGDAFVRSRTHCILLVPSALAPREHHCLINPGHPDFMRIRIRSIEPVGYDPRLFRKPIPRQQARRVARSAVRNCGTGAINAAAAGR